MCQIFNFYIIVSFIELIKVFYETLAVKKDFYVFPFMTEHKGVLLEQKYDKI